MDSRQTWNEWNEQSNREHHRGPVQERQAKLIIEWLKEDLPGDAQILDVGCGTGWLEESLAPLGSVTGTDLADEALDRARHRLAHLPSVRFVAGDFLEVALDDEGLYDAVVTVEAMAHFEDQEGFLRRIADLLKPGGSLIIAAQNRPMMERNIRDLPNHGWHRRWVDRHELRALVEPLFQVRDIRSICPKFFRGPLHVLNSEQLERHARRLGVAAPLLRVKRWEEDRFMGFTLMCRAVKRA